MRQSWGLAGHDPQIFGWGHGGRRGGIVAELQRVVHGSRNIRSISIGYFAQKVCWKAVMRNENFVS